MAREGAIVLMDTVIMDEIGVISSALSEKIGEHKYRVWFENTAKMSFVDGELKIAVPNAFTGNWLEKHFMGDISFAANQAMEGDVAVSIDIEPTMAESYTRSSGASKDSVAGKLSTEAKRQANSRVRKRPSARKRLKLSFDNFVVGRHNKVAYNAALSAAAVDGAVYNPLFIHGSYGLGKTHLLQGICNELQKQRPESKWAYVSAEDFTNQYIMAMKERKLESFRRRYRELDLLAIDDIHFLAGKNSTQQEFLHTFNSIDLAGKQVILASDEHPNMINELCEKLVNRFVSGMVVKIDRPDFDTRLEICQNKLAEMGKMLPCESVKYVAEHIKGSVRELEGALLKLIAYSALHKGVLSLAVTRSLLGDHLVEDSSVMDNKDAKSAVADYFGISVGDIDSAKKDRTVSLARSFAMYMVRKNSNMSFPEIGKLMGGKNHATVIMACRKVEGLLRDNSAVSWKSSVGNRAVKAQGVLSKLNEVVGV